MTGVLSWLYLAGVRTRHWLYDRKIFTQKFAPLPVISIGNLVAGGAGKTQATLLLAKHLDASMRVAILSRGYKGGAEHRRSPLVVDLQKHSPTTTGDEPWLLASRLGSALVVVNKSRFKSALAAQKRGARLLILDDGMQHRQLHRDFEIVVIDGATPLKGFLPRGKLREDPVRLSGADLVLFIGSPQDSVQEHVSQLTDAPQVVAHITSEGLFDLDGNLLEPLQGKKVGLFCGIGNPHRFVQTVEALGAEVVATYFAPDHVVPNGETLSLFAAEALQKGASLLVCTEKDKVKLPKKRLALPIGWIKASLEIIQNQKAWVEMVNEMKLIVGIAP